MHPSPPAAGDTLTALRAGTSEAHQQMEQQIEIERCVTDQGRYTRLLQTFLGFYRPLEGRLAALDGWEAHGVDLTARRKTPWLEADLQALGLTTPEIDALPDCAGLPSTASLARGFGCLYVLEGATLGGRQITALLRDSPIPPTARRFFGSYGAETGARWREFIAALEGAAAGAGDRGRAETIDAARETFSRLHGWVVR